jgi:hypothetical protein
MLLVLFAFEGMAGPLPPLLLVPLETEPPFTTMATSETQEAPLLPHAFTCSVCGPELADTFAFTASAFTAVVFELLSSEYPMALTERDEHVAAVADNANGEVTAAPFAGEWTVIPFEVVFVVVCDVIVMGISLSHAAPGPHDFTCSVCLPVDAVTDARIDVLFTMDAFGLLSSE